MRTKTVILLIILFIATFLSGSIITSYAQNDENFLFFLQPEQSFDLFSSLTIDPATNKAMLTYRLPEQPSPHDWISEDQIEVYQDKIIINLENAEWAKFTDTNSMDPVIDAGSNAIEIRPTSPEDIHVGDIISFKDRSGDTIIHRVNDIGYDNESWYAVTKGDNTNNTDPDKVRFEQVQRILVMIIY